MPIECERAIPEAAGSPRDRKGLRPWLLGTFAAAVLVHLALASATVSAGFQQEANLSHWIWHPSGNDTHSFPAEARYFRKSFRVKEESQLAVDVPADPAFVLYLDGKLVAEGNDWATVQRVEAKLGIGSHVLAVRASNEAFGPAGLPLRGGVLPLGQGVPIQTHGTWRSWDRAPEGDGWTKVDFDDRGWARGRGPGTARLRAVGTACLRRPEPVGAVPRSQWVHDRDRRAAYRHRVGGRLHV